MKKIMSVDDSSSIRKIVRSSLEKHNYEIVEAENGQDALNKIGGHNDIVLFLVDVNMPEMDGITFVQELRKRSDHTKTPVIMLTTEDQNERKAQGKAAGANGWIVKPFNPDELLKVIQTLTS